MAHMAVIEGEGMNIRIIWAGIAAAILILVLVIVAIFNHQSSTSTSSSGATGQVHISTTDPGADVTMTWLGDPSAVKTVNAATGTGGLTASLKPGLYAATVTENNLSTQQTVTIVANQTTSLTLNPEQPGVIEPVSDKAAINVSASTSSLTFTDQNNNDLYTVDSSNQIHLLDSGHAFTNIEWADPSYGVGRSSNNLYYVISGGTFTPVNPPFVATTSSSFGLAPNRQLYITDGTRLYVGQAGGAFKQILKSTHHISILSAGTQAVAISEDNGSNEHDQGTLLTVTPSGSFYQTDGESYSVAWSPNGDLLALSSDDGTEITNAQLKQSQSIPSANINAPVWLNETTLLYGLQGSLWTFNTITGQANVIAAMPSGDYVSGITPSSDSAYIYILLQDNNTSGSPAYHLYRTGLKGQTVTATQSGLDALLPDTIGQCILGYLDFTQPGVLINGPAGQASSCIQQAQSYFQPYSGILDTGSLQYQYTTY
jgi:hypothetical protein